jgi:predicted murein hydrolase (TIGR00659 family)
MPPIAEMWVYLTETPLLWLTATLAAYAAAVWLYERAGRNPLANPVALSVAILAPLLLVTGTPYETYFDGAQFVHFLLGPATVALAVPLVQNLRHVRRALLPLAAALVAGSVTAVGTSVGFAWALGADPQTIWSLAPKSVTTPIAMGIAEQTGGLPSLTAVLVVTTGIIGAMIATPLLNLCGIRDPRAQGVATGVAAHGIGTARAFQVHPLAGTFSGIAMGLNGVATALILPAAIGWAG